MYLRLSLLPATGQIGPIQMKHEASDSTNIALLTATPMNLLSPWRKIIPYLLAERYPPSNLRFDCFKDHRGSICQKRPRWTWRNYAGTMETKIVSYASDLLITFARDCANMVVNTSRPLSLQEKHVRLRKTPSNWDQRVFWAGGISVFQFCRVLRPRTCPETSHGCSIHIYRKWGAMVEPGEQYSSRELNATDFGKNNLAWILFRPKRQRSLLRLAFKLATVVLCINIANRVHS